MSIRTLGIVSAALLSLWSSSGRSGDDGKPKSHALAARAQKHGAKQKELQEALRGTWERLETRAGENPPVPRPEYQRWALDENFVTTEVTSDAADVCESNHCYHLNPLRDPPEITLHSGHGLLQGIYNIKGDVFTIATCGTSDVERPKGFTAADAGELASPLVVRTFKRAKAKRAPAPEWEKRAVKALLSADRNALPALAAEFQKLPAETRRGLPLAIRDDAVEVTFRGEIPLGETINFVEFLIAGEDKDYEALLVAPKGELERLPTLRPFFDAHRGKDRRQWWQARLMWVEDEKPRGVDLGDVFGPLTAKDRAAFLDGQEIDGRGYFGGEDTTGMNVKCDPAVLPRKPGPAVLQLVLRRAPQK